MYKPFEDAVFQVFEGEAVILDLRSGTYFGLNEVGTRVWQLIVERRDEPEIVDIIASEYDADRGTVERDVARLLEELRQRKLIVAEITGAGP